MAAIGSRCQTAMAVSLAWTTQSKNGTNVEASHPSNRLHLSDPMRVQGIVEGWALSNPTLTRRRAAVRVGTFSFP